MQYSDIIMEVFCNNIDNAESYGSYGTNGEDESKLIIRVDTWEDASKLNDIFEKVIKSKKISTDYINFNTTFPYLEFAVGEDGWKFTDEYYMCDDCLKIFPRIDKYTANYSIIDGDIICPNCIRENPENYLDYLINNPEDANRFLDEKVLNAYGFVKVNETNYANGYYDRHDDPKQIYKDIKEKNENVSILFSISNVNPFEVEFDVYVKE